MNALVVRNELPVNTVQEFIDYARKNPGRLNYGSTGSGSSNHLSMELFMKMTGVKLAHIPYKGSAPAVTAMLAARSMRCSTTCPTCCSRSRPAR
jgi:tripartite-type tricarboxylate transporter receptor subunit TctC